MDGRKVLFGRMGRWKEERTGLPVGSRWKCSRSLPGARAPGCNTAASPREPPGRSVGRPPVFFMDSANLNMNSPSLLFLCLTSTGTTPQHPGKKAVYFLVPEYIWICVDIVNSIIN
jgi:hypothetical protein